MKFADLIICVPEPIRTDGSEDKRLISFDDTNRPTRKAPLWPWKKNTHYVVTVTNDPDRNAARCERLPVPIPAANPASQHVNLQVSYSVWCLPSNAEAFAKWHHENQSTSSLDERLQTAARSAATRAFENLQSSSDLKLVVHAVNEALKAVCPSLEVDAAVVCLRDVVPEWEAGEFTPVDLKFEDYSHPVSVRTKELRLRLVDIRRYLTCFTHSNLAAWSSWAVKQSAREVMEETTRKSYIEFLSEWPAIRESIRARVAILAEQIGYRVVALLNEPDTPEYAALRELQITIDAPFKTKDTEVDVKLSIFVTGRLQDLRAPAVRSAVRSEKDIRQRLADSIVTVVQADMHHIPANDFFLYFNVLEAASQRSETVESHIERLVRSVLAAWHVTGLADISSEADEAKVAVKRGDSEVTVMLHALRQEPISIMDVGVPTAGTGHVTRYNFVFVVRGIDAAQPDAYAKLATLCGKADSAAVRDLMHGALTELLLSNLHTLRAEAVRYQDTDVRRDLHNAINRLVREFAAREFGLTMELQTVRRGQTLEELSEQRLLEAKAESQQRIVTASYAQIEEARLGWMGTLSADAKDGSRPHEEREDALKKIEKYAQAAAVIPKPLKTRGAGITVKKDPFLTDPNNPPPSANTSSKTQP